jgi:hypothetical protein
MITKYPLHQVKPHLHPFWLYSISFAITFELAIQFLIHNIKYFIMKLSVILLTIMVSLFSLFPTKSAESTATSSSNKIQVALLLDTSNSMDGLIEQAKSRLWNIINTLTTLKYDGKEPQIEIALYEYGNDGLSSANNFIRQVAPLTTDLDLISEKLFALRTNGGSEYCGAVIQNAVKTLKWNDGNADMKLIYIAGNEPFNQGPINYKEAISHAQTNKIYVNTILCGSNYHDELQEWKDGATRGQGKFFVINSDKVLSYIDTPYDRDIDKLNQQLNDTYIGYGKKGKEKKIMQTTQDYNAESKSMANKVERVVSKSKGVYKNAEWDIVDKYKDNPSAIQTMESEELPEELKGKSPKQTAEFIQQKSKERDEINQKIKDLSLKRQQYIDAENKKSGNDKDDLGKAIETSIIELGLKIGYKKSGN